MSDRSVLDDWLDQWEELHERGNAPSLEAFIARHCANAPAWIIDQFREQVQRLASADAPLRALAGAAESTRHSGSPDESHAAAADIRLQSGTEPVPGYRLEARLGGGGFGEVWRATGPGGFAVALKFVRVDHHVGVVERRALEIIKQVRHPHLLVIFGSWEVDGFLVIAMELADRTLADRLREVRAQGQAGIPRDELLEYLAEAAKGLDHLHAPEPLLGGPSAPSLQHQDIKPANLLPSGGSLKVGDFSLIRALEHSLTRHTGGQTHAYAAPELFESKTSRQVDQYALAVTYCELRGGRRPFVGDSAAQLMKAHLDQQPDLTMLPPEERPILARALAKKPEPRWPSCGAFAAAVREAVCRKPSPEPLPAAPRSSVPGTAPGRPTRRWQWAMLAAVLAGLGAFSFLVWPGGRGYFSPFPGAATGRELAAAAGRIRLTVQPLENRSPDKGLDGVGYGLGDVLASGLRRVPSIEVDGVEPAPDTVLSGTYTVADGQVVIDVRLVSTQTGAVFWSDQITGTIADFVRVQGALVERVRMGLNVPMTEEERLGLARRSATDFEAFRLYGAAALARGQGRGTEAEGALQKALARDPQFHLARQELAALEAAALARLTAGAEERLTRAGEVGRVLARHREQQRAAVVAGKHDPAYFAGLILLSAHAGLLGDTEQERQLLALYWKQYTDTIAPAQALSFADAIHVHVRAEGKFFQDRIDGGNYGMFLKGHTKPEDYLKAELQEALHWPTCAAIWPFDFDFDLRYGYWLAKEVQDPKQFEKRLPHYPHDYVKRLLQYDGHDQKDPRLVEAVRMQMSVVSYYAAVKEGPASWAESVTELQKGLLYALRHTGPEQWDAAFVREAIMVLEKVAKGATAADLRQEADQLLLRYVRQARINAGQDADAPVGGAQKITFCGLPLAGPRIVFLWDQNRPAPVGAVSYIHEHLPQVIRSLSPAHQFNIYLCGRSRLTMIAASAFPAARKADAMAQQEALKYVLALEKKLPEGKDQLLDVKDTLVPLLTNWPPDQEGDLCIICCRQNALLPGPFPERKVGPPRIHFVGVEKIVPLGKLVRDTGGSAMLLERGKLLQIGLQPWDVSSLK